MTREEEQFDLYQRELIEWNKKFNLTSVTDPKEIKTRHFDDSLSVLEAIDLQTQSVVDIGAGAGFPGIPLKIVRPGIKLTLIEATRKKVEFLDQMIKILDLKGAEAVWGRAETLSKQAEYKGKYDIAVARAVAKLPELIEYCLPFLKPGGRFIAMKQEKPEDEVKAAGKALKKYGGVVKETKKVSVGGINRKLLVIEKI
jgi:16S rRNA (guanine527-N7)-methyltransferase